MNTVNFSKSMCRLCQHYSLEGRRGGHCDRLGDVIVQGQWNACNFYIPPFAPAWELIEIEDININWHKLNLEAEEDMIWAEIK